MSGRRIIEGVKQALAWVRGDTTAARLWTQQELYARRAEIALEAGELAAYHCLSENAKWSDPMDHCLLPPGTCPGCIALAKSSPYGASP